MNVAWSWPFLRLYVLTLLYFSANAMLNVIIPLKGASLGASNTAIGIVMGAYLCTTMCFRPWAGQVIHKHGPIKVLRIILVINGFALLLYPFTGLGGYAVARILQGVCTAFFSMALQLGIIDALPDKDRSQGISLYSLCSYMPGLFGPLLALSMWGSDRMHYFTVAMIAIAVSTGAVGYSAQMSSEPSRPAAQKTGQGDMMFKSFSRLIRNRQWCRCSLLMLVASIVFGAVTTFIPLYAGQIESGNAGMYLMLQAGTVVLARLALRKKIPSDGHWHASWIIGIMLLLTAAALSLSGALTAGAVWLYLGAVLMGFAQALLYPILTTYLTFVLPPADRNVMIGWFIAMADMGVSLGSLVMGLIADHTSYSAMYLLCAGLGAAMVIVAYERRRPTLRT
ncbi:staphylopine family metallophore export MFS transporter CntE [Paenibacillus solanacearum]|uniref:staphylopine family metallophore export MFS transporter CntE n=1 Tax=Paenibacillus solanacearum TaxID=2048548 RepID=UPI001C403192|nr:MFS transporter [Paenibacillus solanacearum]